MWVASISQGTQNLVYDMGTKNVKNDSLMARHTIFHCGPTLGETFVCYKTNRLDLGSVNGKSHVSFVPGYNTQLSFMLFLKIFKNNLGIQVHFNISFGS